MRWPIRMPQYAYKCYADKKTARKKVESLNSSLAYFVNSLRLKETKLRETYLQLLYFDKITNFMRR